MSHLTVRPEQHVKLAESAWQQDLCPDLQKHEIAVIKSSTHHV